VDVKALRQAVEPRTASDAMSDESDGHVAMMDIEEKRETGASLMFLGLGIWMMDLLVVFFLPSGIKFGHYATFLSIIIAMGVLGLVLLIIGYKVRGKSSAE
jgi:NO-binding membrane sensor protein with MHYT domain